MCGLIRIDGTALRFMGVEPAKLPALQQTNVTVTATTTTYEFEDHGVALEVEFLSPLLPNDLELLTRPVSYITFTLHALDGKEHAVEIYLDNTATFAVNSANQTVTAARDHHSNIELLSFQSVDQQILGRKGDNVRIDWGMHYLAIPNDAHTQTSISATELSRRMFINNGVLPKTDDSNFPRAANNNWPGLSFVHSFDKLNGHTDSCHVMMAYDELYSVEYFHRKLQPYWKRDGLQIGELLAKADAEYTSIRTRCQEFDQTLRQDLINRGGKKYAQIAELAFRQCLSAHTIVQDVDGTLLMFSKENFSNGCIGTVDVTYPSAPFFLYFNPELLKAQIVPILKYAASPRWKFPFAPHDLGTYPIANGQVYGGAEHSEENQMPVEECGNMLILTTAVCKMEKRADFANQHWPTLVKWADYLMQCGFDPKNQLCTDDFAGHLAHNANLSLKAILGIAAFGQLCELRGDQAQAQTFHQAAQNMAMEWMKLADDGDHYRLAFDQKGSWSQKYNLVWQSLFGLNLFPASVLEKEIAYYLKKQNPFGLPLDNRADYTKADWIVWTACLAKSKEDFQTLVEPLYDFLHHSSHRVPFTDFYDSKTALKIAFQARSVVGGVFLPLLKPF